MTIKANICRMARWRGTENLPDHGWTANIFNSRVHPNHGILEALTTIAGLVITVIGVVAGVFGLIFQCSWTGQAFLMAVAAFLCALFIGSGG